MPADFVRLLLAHLLHKLNTGTPIGLGPIYNEEEHFVSKIYHMGVIDSNGLLAIRIH